MKARRSHLAVALAALWVCCGAVDCPAISLKRGPFIQMGHFTNQTTVAWYTDISADSWVDYGLTPDYGFTAGGPAGVRHEVALTGLEPGTSYHYRVRSAGVNLASARFVSAKAPGMSFRIGLFSDVHKGGAGGVGARMALYEPDLVLAAGDLTDGGLLGELHTNLFLAFPAVLQRAPLYWTPGNHDYPNWFDACRQAFTLPDDELNYWFEYADAQIVSVNASVVTEGLPGTAWLDSALAASDKPWKIVFLHQPGRCGGGPWERAVLRDEYVPIMEYHGVRLVVSGHVHYHWRSVPFNGVTHLTLGRSGDRSRTPTDPMPWYTAAWMDGAAARSFAVADFSGPYMRLRGVTEAGAVMDDTLVDRECAFALDGYLDPGVTQVASRPGGLTLWAAVSGRYLYLATQDAGEGNDHFILLAAAPGTMTNLRVWAKSGTIMTFDGCLADENDNRHSAWYADDGLPFNDLPVARSATSWNNGGKLEGVLDLQALYGGIPEVIYLAAAAYGTANNGALAASLQCPAGNGNAHIESNEFIAVRTAALVRPFTMDGLLDRRGYQVAENNGMKLWAAVHGDTLYVATWAAGNSCGPHDHFIFVADTLSPMGPAPWKKAGRVALDVSSQPYLADESSSSVHEWYNGGVSAQKDAGAHSLSPLEGTLNLVEVFGAVPETLYIAVAPYATADGGVLRASAQVPAGNGDGDITADEFLAIPVAALRDQNLDGILDYLDPTRGFAVHGICAAEEAGALMQWPAIPGHIYRLQATPDLRLPFEDISPDLPAAQGQFGMSYTNAAPPAGPRFFRARLAP